MSGPRTLYATAFLRALATGTIGVLLGFYLAELRLNPGTIGLIVASGLAGATLATLFVSVAADRLGRRRSLVGLSVLGGLGGLALALSARPGPLVAAAFLGMVNGMGRDRGGSLVLEQALLPATVPDDRRTFAFAAYNVAQDLGHAMGALLAAAAGVMPRLGTAHPLPVLRWSIGVYVVLTLLPALLYLRLPRALDGPGLARRPGALSPETRAILWRISSLFAIDSLAGGFLSTALLAYFFHERFGIGLEAVGILFFGARVANALSHFGAAWLARRIGLVNTMVFTHLPSSLLLVTVAFAPNFPIAALFFLLREGLVEMDVPTRQSYLMAVVQPDERTAASAVTHLVRLAGWAAAPGLAGMLMGSTSLGTPLFVGAGLKIAYDLMLYRAFRHLPPPEER